MMFKFSVWTPARHFYLRRECPYWKIPKSKTQFQTNSNGTNSKKKEFGLPLEFGIWVLDFARRADWFCPTPLEVRDEKSLVSSRLRGSTSRHVQTRQQSRPRDRRWLRH